MNKNLNESILTDMQWIVSGDILNFFYMYKFNTRVDNLRGESTYMIGTVRKIRY